MAQQDDSVRGGPLDHLQIVAPDAPAYFTFAAYCDGSLGCVVREDGRILEVKEEGWAFCNGIQQNDEIIRIDPRDLSQPENSSAQVLSRLRSDVRPLKLTLKRTKNLGKEFAVVCTEKKLGFRYYHSYVVEVKHNTWADTQAGMLAGDKLVSIDGLNCENASPEEMLAALRKPRPTKIVVFRPKSLEEAVAGMTDGILKAKQPQEDPVGASMALTLTTLSLAQSQLGEVIGAGTTAGGALVPEESRSRAASTAASGEQEEQLKNDGAGGGRAYKKSNVLEEELHIQDHWPDDLTPATSNSKRRGGSPVSSRSASLGSQTTNMNNGGLTEKDNHNSLPMNTQIWSPHNSSSSGVVLLEGGAALLTPQTSAAVLETVREDEEEAVDQEQPPTATSEDKDKQNFRYVTKTNSNTTTTDHRTLKQEDRARDRSFGFISDEEEDHVKNINTGELESRRSKTSNSNSNTIMKSSTPSKQRGPSARDLELARKLGKEVEVSIATHRGPSSEDVALAKKIAAEIEERRAPSAGDLELIRNVQQQVHELVARESREKTRGGPTDADTALAKKIAAEIEGLRAPRADDVKLAQRIATELVRLNVAGEVAQSRERFDTDPSTQQGSSSYQGRLTTVLSTLSNSVSNMTLSSPPTKETGSGAGSSPVVLPRGEDTVDLDLTLAVGRGGREQPLTSPHPSALKGGKGGSSGGQEMKIPVLEPDHVRFQEHDDNDKGVGGAAKVAQQIKKGSGRGSTNMRTRAVARPRRLDPHAWINSSDGMDQQSRTWLGCMTALVPSPTRQFGAAEDSPEQGAAKPAPAAAARRGPPRRAEGEQVGPTTAPQPPSDGDHEPAADEEGKRVLRTTRNTETIQVELDLESTTVDSNWRFPLPNFVPSDVMEAFSYYPEKRSTAPGERTAQEQHQQQFLSATLQTEGVEYHYDEAVELVSSGSGEEDDEGEDIVNGNPPSTTSSGGEDSEEEILNSTLDEAFRFWESVVRTGDRFRDIEDLCDNGHDQQGSNTSTAIVGHQKLSRQPSTPERLSFWRPTAGLQQQRSSTPADDFGDRLQVLEEKTALLVYGEQRFSSSSHQQEPEQLGGAKTPPGEQHGDDAGIVTPPVETPDAGTEEQAQDATASAPPTSTEPIACLAAVLKCFNLCSNGDPTARGKNEHSGPKEKKELVRLWPRAAVLEKGRLERLEAAEKVEKEDSRELGVAQVVEVVEKAEDRGDGHHVAGGNKHHQRTTSADQFWKRVNTAEFRTFQNLHRALASVDEEGQLLLPVASEKNSPKTDHADEQGPPALFRPHDHDSTSATSISNAARAEAVRGGRKSVGLQVRNNKEPPLQLSPEQEPPPPPLLSPTPSQASSSLTTSGERSLTTFGMYYIRGEKEGVPKAVKTAQASFLTMDLRMPTMRIRRSTGAGQTGETPRETPRRFGMRKLRTPRAPAPYLGSIRRVVLSSKRDQLHQNHAVRMTPRRTPRNGATPRGGNGNGINGKNGNNGNGTSPRANATPRKRKSLPPIAESFGKAVQGFSGAVLPASPIPSPIAATTSGFLFDGLPPGPLLDPLLGSEIDLGLPMPAPPTKNFDASVRSAPLTAGPIAAPKFVPLTSQVVEVPQHYVVHDAAHEAEAVAINIEDGSATPSALRPPMEIVVPEVETKKYEFSTDGEAMLSQMRQRVQAKGELSF
eukprot:g10054.t1